MCVVTLIINYNKMLFSKLAGLLYYTLYSKHYLDNNTTKSNHIYPTDYYENNNNINNDSLTMKI